MFYPYHRHSASLNSPLCKCSLSGRTHSHEEEPFSIGGSTEYDGLVEVGYNEAWGTICDDVFDTSDTTVIGTQL